MFEVEHHCYEGLALPVVHEVKPASRRPGHAEVLEYLHAKQHDIRGELDAHGAVLLRGFAIEDARAFQDVVRVFAPSLLGYQGGDSPRTAVTDKVYTSTTYPAALPISLHNEMSYTCDFPALIAFYCEVAPASGGETPLADCRRVLAALPPRIVEQFETRRVRYVQNLHAGKGLGRSWRDTFETADRERVEAILRERRAELAWKPDGSLRMSEIVAPVIAHPRTHDRVFFSQAHLWHVSSLDPRTRDALLKMVGEADLYHSCTYGDGAPIDADDLAETRRAYESCAVAFPWQQHDVLLVDNVLVAHGRKPFQGDRRILVAMG